MVASHHKEAMMRVPVMPLVALAATVLGGCRMSGPVGDHPGTMAPSREPALISETTREVLTKRAPDTLIARDGSSCRVATDVYAATAPGSQFRCPWVPGNATSDSSGANRE
jgi:hypothetical protein